MNKISRLPTIVTCMYDIRKLENADLNTIRNGKHYLEFAEKFLLNLPYPLIIFLDPTDDVSIKFIEEKREKYSDRTYIYKEKIEDSYFYKKYDRIKELEQTFQIQNRNPTKDTALYMLLGYNKFSYMEKAIEINPFYSFHFVWLDFGVNHIAQQTEKIHEWIHYIPDKIRQMCIHKYYKKEPYIEMFKNIHHHFAAGLFSGNIMNMLKYINLFKNKVEEILNEGWYQLEEAIMTIIHHENPDLFDLYYGNYDAIVSNYYAPIRSVNMIVLMYYHFSYNNDSLTNHHLSLYLDRYFDKIENRKGDDYYDYIRNNIIHNYNNNNHMLRKNIIIYINESVMNNDECMVGLVEGQVNNIKIYENKNLIVPIYKDNKLIKI